MLEIENAVWIGSLVAVGLMILLHRIRLERKQQHAHLYEIPPFLRGTSDLGGDAHGIVETDWLEIHPAPGRHRRKD